MDVSGCARARACSTRAKGLCVMICFASVCELLTSGYDFGSGEVVDSAAVSSRGGTMVVVRVKQVEATTRLAIATVIRRRAGIVGKRPGVRGASVSRAM
ncbi:uncharacterized protein A4U43_C08F19080 [Asparagus officinalis]|nr:uncharacterized protein A4U43_C08F19080 [Asparagus officinalis]